jgi:uncharacterized protein YkwD
MVPIVLRCIVCVACSFPLLCAAQSRQDAEDRETLLTAEVQEIAQGIHQRANRFRDRQGLGELRTDPDLRQAAMDFAAFMARTGKYGHEADGRQPAERAAAAGYRYCRVTENIAYRYQSRDLLDEDLVKLFVQGWKRSPEHRENLLDPRVIETGIGVAFGDSMTTVYAVQLFGRPRSEQIDLVINNRSGLDVSLKISTNGNERTVELPNRTRLEVAHCFPTTVQIIGPDHPRAGDDTALTVEQSTELAIRVGQDGNPKLLRR